MASSTVQKEEAVSMDETVVADYIDIAQLQALGVNASDVAVSAAAGAPSARGAAVAAPTRPPPPR